MNERDLNPEALNLEESNLEDLSAENLHPNDASWARLLSSASQLSATDQTATDSVLARLRAERANPMVASQEDWDRGLARAARLRDVDFAAVNPALQAVKQERHHRQHRRLVLSRVIAGFATAVVIAGALVLRAPSASDRGAADPSEAYMAYQEANQGW
jgi:hypothetical protein